MALSAVSIRAAALTVVAFAACGGGAPRPARLDVRSDACQTCRMVVSDARFAAQLVAPGEEPRFFDDVGCLAAYLDAHRAEVNEAAAFVADHRTKEWVPAAYAVFVRAPRADTPMGSHILAHATLASRQADPEAVGGTPLAIPAVFGPQSPPSTGIPRKVSR